MLSQFIVAGIIGIMLFFTVAVAPGIFRVLPQEWAAIYVRAFFPKYYAVLGIAALLAGLLETDMLPRIVEFICAGLFFFSLLVLTPQINQARDGKRTTRFGVLHGLSVVFNLAQLGLLIWTLWRAGH